MRIVLACDQKWRDLPSLVAIRHHLKLIGHRAVIISTRELDALLPVVQPDMVVLNNFWDMRYHNLARRLRQSGIAIGVLPTEGESSLRVWGPIMFGGHSDYSLLDFHLCWNRDTANGIVEYGAMKSHQVDVIGCPRFDFAVPPLSGTCMTRKQFSDLLKLDSTRPIVTWASRYAHARLAYATPEARAAFDLQCKDVGIEQCLAAFNYTLDDLVNTFKTSLDSFIDAFRIAAKARPDVQFVFKPHPLDDVRYIENRIGVAALANVRMGVGIYIGDALRSSDVLVNADCTTSLEAWIQNVPVIDAQLHPDSVIGRPDIAACNRTARNPDEIINLIDLSLADRTIPPELVEARAAFLANACEVVDGKRCRATAEALSRYARIHGSRRKLYPARHGGGTKHVAKKAISWLASVPAGVSLRSALYGLKKINSETGVFDKTITRKDVRAQARRIEPFLSGAGL